MNYYLDTEFLEGPQSKTVMGIKYGQTKPTIDLISIGIVAEDGREYYAISKDFNLKEAWNRYQIKESPGESKKEYWIRENVLYPIFKELYNKSIHDPKYVEKHFYTIGGDFTYKHLKSLIEWYGKGNQQIASEIKEFTHHWHDLDSLSIQTTKQPINIQFYAYYADYDWVVFCWLFGRMIDLPKGFPMYCRDLKQMLDEKVKVFCASEIKSTSFDSALKRLKVKHALYPKEENAHNALDDAKWNKRLHEFIIKSL